MTTIRPVANNILIEVIEIEAKKNSTILILAVPESEKQFKILDIGDAVKVELKKGQKVLVKKDAELVRVEDKKYIIKDEDVLGIYV